MVKFFRIFLAVAFLAQTTHVIAKQKQTYANDVEIFGASHAALLNQEKMINGWMSFCEKNHKELSTQINDSLKEWQNRNQKYFILFEGLRDELDETIKNDKNSNTTIEEYEQEMTTQLLPSILAAFEEKHNAMNEKGQVVYCQDVVKHVMNGDLDIAHDPQVKVFLDQRLLDDVAPNLIAEIEIPVPANETAKSIEANALVNLQSIGTYTVSSKQTQIEGASLSVIRITFERHFARAEARPLADQLFKTLDANLPADLRFRVQLKIGMSDQINMRLPTPN